MADVVPGEKPSSGRFHSHPNKIADNAQRDLETQYILERRLMGWSTRKIAASFPEKFGYTISHETVNVRYNQRIAETVVPMASEVRQQEIERIDYLLEKLSTKVDEGDDKAIALAVKLGESRRKLLGADAPQQTEHIIQVISHEQTPLAELMAKRLSDQKALEAEIVSEPEDSDTQSHPERD